jgi:hypothetical protein
MIARKLTLLATAASLLIFSLTTQAENTYVTLTPIYVYDTHIENIDDVIFSPSFETHTAYTYVNAPNPMMYVVAIMSNTLPDLCKNIYMNSELRKTTSKSDVTTRWLAAQASYVTSEQKGLFSLLKQLGGSNGMAIIMNGVQYNGWSVTYSDGVREIWAINPAASISSVKLMDQPMPNSQKKVSAGCDNIA